MTKKPIQLPFRIKIEWEEGVTDETRKTINEDLTKMLHLITKEYMKVIDHAKHILIIKD